MAAPVGEVEGCYGEYDPGRAQQVLGEIRLAHQPEMCGRCKAIE